MEILQKEINKIVSDFLSVDIATIQARIRNKHGIIDKSICKHKEWDITRNICMRCGSTKIDMFNEESR